MVEHPDRAHGTARPAAEPEMAASAGVSFRRLPSELDPDDLDELIRPVVMKINESGWVWTAESCQGHPDATDEKQWHVEPMLRLVCAAQDTGALMAALVEAVRAESDTSSGAIAFTTVPAHRSVAGWTELVIYVQTRTAYDRNRGVAAFMRFAEFVAGRPAPDA